jgi:hemoglobin
MGRDMQTSHKGLGISASDWEIFMRHAAATLEKFAVPAPERDEVLTFFTSLRGDIVA